MIEDGSQGWPVNEKWRYREFVHAYPAGTLCIDADVAVSRDAPDLFALVPLDRVGVSAAPWPPPSFAPKLAAVCRSQGVPVPTGAAAVHWNSGLVVLRPPHADYWAPPPLPLTGVWLDEEMWSKVTVHCHGWPVWDIPHTIHWQWWVDREFAAWERGRPPFAHLAGLGQVPISAEQHRVALPRVMRSRRAEAAPAGAEGVAVSPRAVSSRRPDPPHVSATGGAADGCRTDRDSPRGNAAVTPLPQLFAAQTARG